MPSPDNRKNLEEFLAACKRNVTDVERFIEETKNPKQNPKLLVRARKYLKQGLKTIRAIDRSLNKPKPGRKMKKSSAKAKPEGE